MLIQDPILNHDLGVWPRHVQQGSDPGENMAKLPTKPHHPQTTALSNAINGCVILYKLQTWLAVNLYLRPRSRGKAGLNILAF